ncbi:MAG: hypothetical protein Q7S57_00510 [bacterium]|nr:hypothetical protein [bacterium]
MISKQMYASIMEFIVSTGFFEAVDQESDSNMCESGESLQVKMGIRMNALSSTCLGNLAKPQNVTQGIKRNEKIITDVYEKLKSAIDSVQKNVCN